jgi:hypothetical protein
MAHLVGCDDDVYLESHGTIIPSNVIHIPSININSLGSDSLFLERNRFLACD